MLNNLNQFSTLNSVSLVASISLDKSENILDILLANVLHFRSNSNR